MVINVKELASGKNSIMNASTSDSEMNSKSISQSVKSAIDSVTKNEGKHMSEEDKKKMLARIMAKMKRGKKLTTEELQFLKDADPNLYLQYKRIRAMADSLEAQLKGASSKEQANSIIALAFNGVSDQDPYKEFVMAALSETAKDFRDSPQYARLPDSAEDVKENKKKHKMPGMSDDEDDEENDDNDVSAGDDFDIDNWSPIQEVLDSMPKFHVSV